MNLTYTTRKPWFWISATTVALLCSGIAYFLFPVGFPIVNLDITMHRTQALADAQTLMKKHAFGPESYRQAASFTTDVMTKTFVELEGGGKPAFVTMMEQKRYEPYSWQVRHVQVGEKNETTIRFTPNGTPYGFVQTISEDTTGPDIKVEQARTLAEQHATQNWSIDFSRWSSIESSKQVRPNKRGDHTFVYERPEHTIGEGRYRLRLTVTGDRLTEVTHFVHVPQAFIHRYQEMRSANATIAYVATIIWQLFYILICCVIGLFFLFGQRRVLVPTSILVGLVLGLINLANRLNHLPLLWLYYNTALTLKSFLFAYGIQLIFAFVSMTLYMILIIMGAEALTRKAFGNHVQLFASWSPPVASSIQIAGRTIGGYLIVAIHAAFAISFYAFALNYLGWWTPSHVLFDPNILATYLPWLSPVAQAFTAGVIEECAFRAIPLSCAALLGKRYGKKNWWLAAGFIFQAVVFSAAHAFYPQQPAYARLIELMVPSTIFGGLYLVFGLLPAIIAHFIYDLVFMSLPLFLAEGPTAWFNQGMVILCGAIPLLVIVYGRIRTGNWHNLAPTWYNRAWHPPEAPPSVPEEKIIQQTITLSKKTIWTWIICGAIGLSAWLYTGKFTNDAQTMVVDRTEALQLAQTHLQQTMVFNSTQWTPLVTVFHHYEEHYTENMQHRFVWQEGGNQAYKKLLTSHLTPPSWVVRFVKFTGDIVTRAQQYVVYIGPDGTIYRTQQIVPESIPGAVLEQEQARTIAHNALQKQFHLDPSNLIEVSAEATKRTARRDWKFVFALQKEQYPIATGQARTVVSIAGDTIIDAHQYIHVPETWERTEQNYQTILGIIKMIYGFLLYFLLILGMVLVLANWQIKPFGSRTCFNMFALLIVLFVGNMANNLPKFLALFNTQEPYTNQLFMLLSSIVIAMVIQAAIFALIIPLVTTWKIHHTVVKSKSVIVMALSIGMFFAGMEALTRVMIPSLAPLWGNYAPLGTYLPINAGIFHKLFAYVHETVFQLIAFVVIYYGRKRWHLFAAASPILAVILGILFVATQTSGNIPLILLDGFILSIILNLSYYFVFRYDIALLPLAVAGYEILHTLQDGFLRPYPGALLGSIITVILISLLSAYWYKTMITAEQS